MLFFGGLGPLLGAFGTLVQYLYPARDVLATSFYFNFFYLWEFFFPQLVFFSPRNGEMPPSGHSL